MNKKIFMTLFVFVGFMFFFNCNSVFATSYANGDYNGSINWDSVKSFIDSENSKSPKGHSFDYIDFNKFVLFTYIGKNQNYVGSYLIFLHDTMKINYSSDSSYTIDMGDFIDYSGRNEYIDRINTTLFLFKLDSDGNFVTTLGYSFKRNSTVTLFSESAYGSKDVFRVVTSTSNIYNSSTGDLVFPAAPQGEEQKPISTLQVAPTLTSTDLSGILAQILAILPVVLMVLISLLALRKAIHLLLRILEQA